MTSATPPVLEKGSPSDATKRILTVLSSRDCPLWDWPSWDWHHAIVTMGLAMYLRYPTPESASSMAHCSDSAGEPPFFQALAEHNFCWQPGLQMFVKTNIIPTNESDSKASA